MGGSEDHLEGARRRLIAAVDDYAAAMRAAHGLRLGEGLIHTREIKDRVEAIFVESLQRFDQAGD